MRKQEESAEPIDTFSIITTGPNELMQSIHNRMPAILRRDDYASWLNRETPVETAQSLLLSYDVEEMEAHAVSSKVNRPSHDSPDCCESP